LTTTERIARAAVLTLLVGAIACREDPEASRRDVPDPDLAHLEPQIAEALRRAREQVLRDPDSAEAWGELASSFDAHLFADPAEHCYRTAHDLAPGDFRWAYLLAVAMEINGAGAEEVTAAFRRAAALRPDYATTYLRLGDALWRRGHYEDAAHELRQALALAPDTAIAHRRLGQVMLSLGDAKRAEEHLVRAIELEPGDLAAHTALARAYARLGDAERARQANLDAEGLEPVNAIDDPVHAEQVSVRNVSFNQLFTSGVRRIQEGNPAAAIEPLAAAVGAVPRNPSAHYWLGTAYLRAGRTDAAASHLAQAIELAPRMNAARVSLADLLADAGRSAEAAAHYREALRYAPGDSSVRERLDRLERRP